MARNNGKRFADGPQPPSEHLPIFGTASGVSPVPLPNPAGPTLSPSGRAISTEPPCPPAQSSPPASAGSAKTSTPQANTAPTTTPPASPSASLAATLARPPLIRRARPQDAKFLSHLQKTFSNELGFLPTAALQWYIEQQRVGVVLENGDPAGYVLGRPAYKYQPDMRPITQTAVAMDAQRRHLGLALIARVCQHAVDARQLAVQAICAGDLIANEFWYSAGFESVALLTPGNARRRTLIVWRKQLTHVRPTWFTEPPPTAGVRTR